MAIRLIKTFEEFLTLKEEWDSLLAKTAFNSVFQSFQWHQAWLESFGSSGSPYLVTAWESSHLVGVVPLFKSKVKLNLLSKEKLSFIGGHNFASDYCDLIYDCSDPSILDQMLAWIFNSQDWSLLEFMNLPKESKTFLLICEKLKALSSRVVIDRHADAPTLMMNNEQHVKSIFTKKSMKYAFNVLKKSGDLQFKECTSVDEINSYFPVFTAQHITRRAKAGDASIFLQNSQNKFYELLVQKLLPLNILRFSALLLDGKPIAFHLGFEYLNRFIYYKPTFDLALAQKSPGQVLLRFLIENTAKKKLAEFDFGVGDESYKYRFADVIRENMQIQVYRDATSYSIVKARAKLGKIKRAVFALFKIA